MERGQKLEFDGGFCLPTHPSGSICPGNCLLVEIIIRRGVILTFLAGSTQIITSPSTVLGFRVNARPSIVGSLWWLLSSTSCVTDRQVCEAPYQSCGQGFTRFVFLPFQCCKSELVQGSDSALLWTRVK